MSGIAKEIAGTSEQDEVNRSGWLLETTIGGTPVWFRIARCDGSKWNFTTDASRAVRFARKHDAEQMIEFLVGLGVLGTSWKATGHEWV